MDFKYFDKRNYPVVSARDGYSEWATTYESSVPDLLDIQVLDGLKSVAWHETKCCLDFACGTGRTGQWLSEHEVSVIDGLDITPAMVDKAKKRAIYRSLHVGSVEHTQLSENQYDLIVMCLVDEHLSSLSKVYREARRLSCSNSFFVVVGMHPFFFMNGMPTHFDDSNGEPKAIETHVHLMSDHFEAAKMAGWKLVEIFEGTIDDKWIKIKPKWNKFRGCPINFGYVWKNTSG